MPIQLNDWGKRYWADLLDIISMREGTEIVDKNLSLINAIWTGLTSDGIKTIWKEFAGGASDLYRANLGVVATLLSWEFQTVTGIPISEAQVRKSLEGIVTAQDRMELGRILGVPFLDIFDVRAVGDGYRRRQAGEAETNNLYRFMGANLRLQIGGMGLNSLASVLPFSLPTALTDLPEKVDRVLGWEDLMEEMIQGPMEMLVSEGLKQKYMRETKPTDLPALDAIQAFHGGFMPRETLMAVLDNLGYRDDVRDILIAGAEPGFSDSELRKLLSAQRLTREDVLALYRRKGYGEQRAAHKVFLLEQGDEDDVFDKIDKAYLDLYRDCVISRLEIDQWFASRGWTRDKINAHIALAELERKRRKWLTNSEMTKAMGTALLRADEVHDLLVCQGMTPSDALISLILMETKNIPDDCWEQITAGNIQGILQAIINAIIGGGGQIPPNLLRLVRCLIGSDRVDAALLPPPGDEGPAPRLPSGSFNSLPSSPTVGEQFRLVWSIQNADRVEIDQGIGVVPAQGVRFLIARTNTVWQLRATNEDGVRTFQASILARPAPPPRPVTIPKPTVSLSVSPSSVVEGEPFVVQWETSGADQVFLDDGSGNRAVARSGAQFRDAERSGVYTITASGPGGQRARSDTLLVRPAPEEQVPPPRASVTVTPGHTTAGEQVEVRWSSSNATNHTLEGLGAAIPVPPSGVRIFTAEADTIVVLRAVRMPEGITAIAQDALIVDDPAPPRVPERPAPTIAFNIRPGRAKRGAEVAFEWRTANATLVRLIRAGSYIEVDEVGGLTLTADRSETFILHAIGDGGEKAIAKVLLVV